MSSILTPWPVAVSLGLSFGVAVASAEPNPPHAAPHSGALEQTGQPMRIQRLETALEDARETDREPPLPWYRRIALGGLVEIETSWVSPAEGDDTSDLRLATVELGLSAQVSKEVEVLVSLLYEQDDTDLEIDLAMARLSNPEATPLFAEIGQFYVPFGVYDTHLISDPLTLELGESREIALHFGFELDYLAGGVYLYKGDRARDDDDRIGHWGLHLGTAGTTDELDWSLGAGYLNDLGDADGLQDFLDEARSLARAELNEIEEEGWQGLRNPRVGAWTLHAGLAWGSFSLSGEYLAATRAFNPLLLDHRERGAQPAAWGIEAGYRFELLGREGVVALAYQGTREALALELPRERWLLGAGIEILPATTLALEWSRDRDYRRADGGSGGTGQAIVAQLAVAF